MIRKLIHEVLDELDIKPKKHRYKHKRYGQHSCRYKARKRHDHDDDRYQYHDRKGVLGTLLRLAEGDRPFRHHSEYRYRTYRRRHEDWDD